MAKTYIENIKHTAVRDRVFSYLSKEPQIPLFDAIKLSSGEYLPTAAMVRGEIEVYGGGGKTDKTHDKWNVAERTFGIGRVGARCGCVFEIKPHSWVTDNALFAIIISEGYEIEFLIEYLNFKNINQFANTAAQPVISLKRMSNITVPVIDKLIQRDIAKLLNNFENIDFDPGNDHYNIKPIIELTNVNGEISTELTHQLDLVRKLRQQLLQDAIQGKLVAQEPNDEPASVLLHKIKAEKELLIKNKKLKKEKELPSIKHEETLFEIPENWVWCRLGEMSINCDGERIPVSQSERERKQKTFDYYGASGVIDKIDGYTHDGKFLLISEDGANLVARSTPIAFIASGKFWVNNHAHVVKALDNITLIFLCNYFNSIDLKPFITGGFQPKLSQGNLNIIPISLPPIEEQARVNLKINQLMQTCDALEASIKQSQQQNQQLLQQVLREALMQETV